MGCPAGVQSIQFFRARLLNCKTEAEVQELYGELYAEQKELRRHIYTILWHMRGGLTREEAWTLSPVERKDIMKQIDERLRMTEKTRIPLL